MLSKSFMQYISDLNKPEKEKYKQVSDTADTRPLFYIILKSSGENKK